MDPTPSLEHDAYDSVNYARPITVEDFFRLGSQPRLSDSYENNNNFYNKPTTLTTNDDERPSTTTRVAPPVLYFDTETSSLSRPFVVQLAFVTTLTDAHERAVCHILKLPHNERLDSRAVAIHGLTKRDVAAGRDPSHELRAFFALVARTKAAGGRVVAHNAAFDVRAVNFTAELVGVSTRLSSGDTFCTMRASLSRSPLLNRRGRPKQMTLAQAYELLHGAAPTWARLHCAMDDVLVLECVYTKGAERGWW